MIDDYRFGNSKVTGFRRPFATIQWIAAPAAIIAWLMWVPSRPVVVESLSPDSARSVKQFNWSADGDRLLCVSRGSENIYCRLDLYDARQPAGWTSIDVLGEPIGAATLAADGRHALVGTSCGHLVWIDLHSRELSVLIASSRLTAFTATAISDDQHQIAAADWEGKVYVGDPIRGTPIVLTSNETTNVVDLRFSRDGRLLVCARTDGVICIWDLATRMRPLELTRHEGSAIAAELLPDGRRLISAGGFDGTVRMWDIKTGTELWQRQFVSPAIMSLAISSDGSTAAWGGSDGTVIVWNLEASCAELELRVPGQSIGHLEFSPNGNELSIAGSSGPIRTVERESGAVVRCIPFDFRER
jgi:WD40 repeat protein